MIGATILSLYKEWVQSPSHYWLDYHRRREFNKINLGSKKTLQQVKISVDLKLIVNSQLIELLKEFEDIFAWTYKNMKGIPPKIT